MKAKAVSAWFPTSSLVTNTQPPIEWLLDKDVLKESILVITEKYVESTFKSGDLGSIPSSASK